MKVKELIKKLKKYDPDTLVVCPVEQYGHWHHQPEVCKGYFVFDGQVCEKHQNGIVYWYKSNIPTRRKKDKQKCIVIRST